MTKQETDSLDWSALQSILSKLDNYSKMDIASAKEQLIELLQLTGLDSDVLKKINDISFENILSNEEAYETVKSILNSIPKGVFEMFDVITVGDAPYHEIYLHKNYKDIHIELGIVLSKDDKKIKSAELEIYEDNYKAHINLKNIDTDTINFALSQFLAHRLSKMASESYEKEVVADP